ncbi:hypothetical protein FACS1894132_12600 [Clostridia bacterium]|nr:hypothetical protein FACS1894132_12600 [Clostridia bacterium]
MTSCINSKSKPLLKVTTSTSYDVFGFFSKTNYYIVYENGKKKKTSRFALVVDGNRYLFMSNNADDAELLSRGSADSAMEWEQANEIARNILVLAQKTKLKKVSVGELYIFSERYFFELYFDKGDHSNTKIFEYILVDNSIKELATFTKSVTHIELCEGQ